MNPVPAFRTAAVFASILFTTCATAIAQQPAAPAAPAATPATATPGQAPARRGIQADKDHPILPIGSPAPDFSLIGIDGKTHTLAEYRNAKVLAVVFESNHCPVSENYEGRIRAIYKDYKDKGVQLVAINPNNAKAVRLDELGYTDMTDSFPDMKKRAALRHIDWPFLYDGDTQVVATKFGASATPHIFIFDADRKLRYEGRIDDNQTIARVTRNDARDALDAILAGKEVETPHTPAFGCSTKWLYKAGDVEAEQKRIQSAAVSVTPATADDIKTLLANGSQKITVVNFWSPKCAGCSATLSDLETTYWMYKNRDYDFVNVAIDKPDSPQVLQMLKDHYASARNLEVTPQIMASIKSSLPAKWDTGKPLTLVIAPGGKVLWSQSGTFDIPVMRRVVLANMPDGRSYAGNRAYWQEVAGQ
jgi:protein-disulfide isomerase